MIRIPLFLCILAFGFSNLPAQVANDVPQKQCNPSFARQLVEQQADASKSIADAGKRIAVLIRAADFLWTADEETARTYFGEAFRVARDKSLEKPEEKSLQTPFLMQRDVNYPFQVIRAVARRDAEWAKKLTEIALKDTEEIKKNENQKPDLIDNERQAEEAINLAASLAEQNPSAAMYFARRAMRFPLNRNWYFTLYQIAGKNRQLADQIYSELLNNYSTTEVSRLLYLSAYPFAAERIFGAEKFSLGTSVPQTLSPNTNLQRQFLTVFMRRVNSMTPDVAALKVNANLPESAFALMALNELEPVVLRQFPDMKEILLQSKNTANSLISAEAREGIKKREELQTGIGRTFAERIRDIEKADEEGKLTDMQIVNLVTSAKKEEEFKMAESWLDKIREEKVRETATNYFYFSRSKTAVKDKRFEEAGKFAEKVVRIEHRAVLYFDIAEAKLKEPMTKIESLDALWEVFKMAEKSPDSVEKAQVLLGLAFMYEKIDHSNALESLANAIKTANKLENPNLFTSFMSQQIIGKDFASFIGYTVPGFDISQTFGEISKNDFQGALSQAENFSDKYLRALAVLAAIKDCEKNEKPGKPQTEAVKNQ